ncbi:MAG: GHKL domain-containing protein [Oligoflexia bacterium]|nr:GHKL domain-containing protein [Oligoflexia bacterium]
MRNTFKTILYSLIGMMMGSLIPLAFVYLDIQQLEIDFNWLNILEIVNSQNIYPVSFVSFPILFGLICYAFVNIFIKSKELNEKNTFIQEVMDSMNDIIMVFDSELNLIKSNEGFERFYSKFFAPYFSKTDLIELINVKELSEKKGSGIQGISISDSNGISHEFAIHAANTHLNGKESFIISMKSIDEIINKQKIIEEQRQQIEKSSRLSSLGEMAGGIAHEINNPLAIISGNAYKIKKQLKKLGIEDEKLFNPIQNINETVKRVNTITRVLLNLSRNGSDSEDEAIDPNLLIEEVVHLSSSKIRDVGVNLMIKNSTDMNQEFLLNRIKISQILVNLLNNSIDAIAELDERWIELSVEVNDITIAYRIVDCGKGIVPEVVEKIFEPMYTTKDVGKGTGLGLSLSHSLAQDMQGTLYYETYEGNTSFVLEVPKIIAKKSSDSEAA